MEGYEDVEIILKKVKKELSPSNFEAKLDEFNALVLDVRHQNEFSKSLVERGPLKGFDIQSLVEKYKSDFVGHVNYRKFGVDFPILIKFINAEQDLSIQVHPNNKIAQKRHGSLGKREMWCIMHAEPDAKLILGFQGDQSPNSLKKHINENTLESILNYQSVKEGDCFFVDSGKVHSIGGGIVLAEIQQKSDITYRLYDWNRKDKKGKVRELHVDSALDAINYSNDNSFTINYKAVENKFVGIGQEF